MLLSREILLVVVQLLQVTTSQDYVSSYKCPQSWNLHGSSCYRYRASRKMWKVSEDACQSGGGHLASITTAAENKFVNSLFTGATWIGIYEPGDENERVWSDGKAVNYTNWAVNEPNNGMNNQDCVQMNGGKWFDIKCNRNRAYVCEIDATQAPTPVFYTATPATTVSPPASKTVTTAATTTTPEVATTTGSVTTTRAAPASATAVATMTAAATVTTTEESSSSTPSTTSQATEEPATTFMRSHATFHGGHSETPTEKFIQSSQQKTGSVHIPSATHDTTSRDVTATVLKYAEANKSSGNSVSGIAVGVAVGGLCMVAVAVSILSLVYYRHRRKVEAPGNNVTSGSYALRNPVFREVELNSERRHSNVANSESFYSNEANEFDGQSGKATPATTHRLSNAIARKPLQPYQNVYFSAVDTDGGESWNESKTSEPSDDAYEVPMRARFETNTSEENETAGSAPELAFGRLGETIYWEPAATEERLYSQIEGHKFPQILREAITSREFVASGEFGTVEKATWRPAHVQENSVVVAVKTLKSETDEDRVRFLREAALLGQFHHRNVVALYGVVTAGSPLMIVLEYMENGDLKQYLIEQRSSVGSSTHLLLVRLGKGLLKMCRDIASGLEYLEGKSFVHRDLAARNILLDHENTCKIGDFGLSRDLADDTYYVTKGGKLPIRWSAPETWNFRKYSTASDVWSYGIVLYEIWSLGCRPYGVTSNPEVMSMTDQGYRLPPPPGCSRPLYSLMIDCWNPDHHQRPSCGDIVGRLRLADSKLLTNAKTEEDITGKLGDDPTSSVNSYQDIQMTYLQK